jgi:hypothetical protein
MNAHVTAQPAAQRVCSLSITHPTVPVSRVANAAHALGKCADAMLWASTPGLKRIAQENYDAAVEDMRALLKSMDA